jgi:hypothetical protein
VDLNRTCDRRTDSVGHPRTRAYGRPVADPEKTPLGREGWSGHDPCVTPGDAIIPAATDPALLLLSAPASGLMRFRMGLVSITLERRRPSRIPEGFALGEGARAADTHRFRPRWRQSAGRGTPCGSRLRRRLAMVHFLETAPVEDRRFHVDLPQEGVHLPPMLEFMLDDVQ